MVVAAKISQKISLEEFLKLPETKPASEYIDGEIEQKPMSQGEHSTLQIRLGATINEITLPQKLAYAFTELRCVFGGRAIVPDITVFLWDRIPRTAKGRVANKFEIYPDWIIEILSPEQSANKVIKKILFCLEHGTQLGWLIDPEDESVTVFYADKPPEIKEGEEILPVLNILSDWQISAQELFNWLEL